MKMVNRVTPMLLASVFGEWDRFGTYEIQRD